MSFAAACLRFYARLQKIAYLGKIKQKADRLRREYPLQQAGQLPPGGTRIHFLSTGWSDCILLESAGKFALVDAARGKAFGADKEGCEEKILAYLRQFAGADGRVTLEWALGTHAHDDHLGGFPALLRSPALRVKRMYLKPYDASRIRKYELEHYNNQAAYDGVLAACTQSGIALVQQLPVQPFPFGACSVQMFNTACSHAKITGENENSVGLLLVQGSTRAFLAGDINNVRGTETRIAPAVGRVDLLKIGHHGIQQSTTRGFVRCLRPAAAVMTNPSPENLHPFALRWLTKAGCAVFATGEQHGLVAVLGEDGLQLYSGTDGD